MAVIFKKGEEKTIYSKKIDNFGGVDLSNSPLFVSEGRATSISNFIKENEVMKKRSGWKEMNQLNGKGKIHNICKLTNGFLIQSGKKLFYANSLEGEFGEINLQTNETKAEIFAKEGNAYILSGEHFYKFDSTNNDLIRLDYNDLKELDDYVSTGVGGKQYISNVDIVPSVYIPTTTIGITSENTKVYSTKGETLDSVNLLTNWRINTLLTDYVSNKTELDKTSWVSLSVDKAYDIYSRSIINKVQAITNLKTEYEETSTVDSLEGKKTEANVDKIYKFTGDTGKYTKNAFYTILKAYRNQIDFEYKIISKAITESYYSVEEDGTTYVVNEEGIYIDKPLINESQHFILDGIVKKAEKTVGETPYDFFYIHVTDDKGNLLVPYKDYSLSEDSESNKTVIVFEKTYNSLIEGVPNITVTYLDDSFEVNDESNLIGKCTFGTTYGDNNSKDTLFVSGNINKKNYDFHSYSDNWEYFPADCYCSFGLADTKITGYHQLSDGYQAILKEDSVYYRKSELIQAYDASGLAKKDSNGTPLYVVGYPVDKGNIGEGCSNPNSCLSLAGDSLFASKNGIFAIETKASVNSLERYAKPRSRLINTALKGENLSNASFVVYDNKYFVCVSNKCYIADARYPYKLADDLSDTYQYEWFVWDNIPATIFAVINGDLFFGTNEGHICKFDKSFVYDTRYVSIEQGNLSYDSEENVFYFNSSILSDIEYMQSTDFIDIKTNGNSIKSLFLSSEDYTVDIEGNITISEAKDSDYLNEYVSYKYSFGETSNLTIANVEINDNGKTTFNLIDEDEDVVVPSGDIGYEIKSKCLICDIHCLDKDGNVVRLDDGEFLENEFWTKDSNGNYLSRITKIVDGEELNIEKTDFVRFKLCDEEKNEITPMYPIPNLTATITLNQIIKCHYITKMFDLGTVQNLKTIRKLIMTPDCILGTEVEFGCETINDSKMYNAFNGIKQDYDNLDFDSISFGNEFARTWTKKAKFKNTNFVRFIFKNESKMNCKISNLEILYTIGKNNKGVR